MGKAAAEVASAFEAEDLKITAALSPRQAVGRSMSTTATVGSNDIDQRDLDEFNDHVDESNKSDDNDEDLSEIPSIEQVRAASPRRHHEATADSPAENPVRLTRAVLSAAAGVSDLRNIDAAPTSRSVNSPGAASKGGDSDGEESFATVDVGVSDDELEIDTTFQQVSKTTRLSLQSGNAASAMADGLPAAEESVAVGVDHVVHFRITIEEAHVNAAVLFRRAVGGGSEYALLPKSSGCVAVNVCAKVKFYACVCTQPLLV